MFFFNFVQMIYCYNNDDFFYGKDKANERACHLMVSDHRRPRPRATPEELQVRCLPVRWLGAGARHYLMRNAVA